MIHDDRRNPRASCVCAHTFHCSARFRAASTGEHVLLLLAFIAVHAAGAAALLRAALPRPHFRAASGLLLVSGAIVAVRIDSYPAPLCFLSLLDLLLPARDDQTKLSKEASPFTLRRRPRPCSTASPPQAYPRAPPASWAWPAAAAGRRRTRSTRPSPSTGQRTSSISSLCVRFHGVSLGCGSCRSRPRQLMVWALAQPVRCLL